MKKSFDSMRRSYAKNIEVIGYHDLDGKPGFQMALQKIGREYYLYLASFRHNGWTILNITDPAHPEKINWIDGPDSRTWSGQGTPKIQIADGIMITALGGTLPMLHGTRREDPHQGGIMIWDVNTDPARPKLLSTWHTGSPGGGDVHRSFYNGGRYVHLAATCPGFRQRIYRILDIIDPTCPVEVGRWWSPDQYLAGCVSGKDGLMGVPAMQDLPALHAVTDVRSNRAYLGYGGGGFVILDISDITTPKIVGSLKLLPPFGGKRAGNRCHTAMPLTGRNFAVVTNEGERFACFSKEMLLASGAQPLNNLHMVDISDETDPVLIAEFPYPEVPGDFPFPNFNSCGLGAQGPFGPHNIHEPHSQGWYEDDPNRIYCCYFHAGMRIYDTSDPYRPKEIAYFIPPNPQKQCFPCDYPGPLLGTAEDCLVDDRGYIYMDTFHDGVYILKCTV